MQGRILIAVPIFILLGSKSLRGIAQAQVSNQSLLQSPTRPFVARTVSAPDWLVWFSFYDMCNSFSRGKAAEQFEARDMVASRLGIEPKLASLLLELGHSYEQHIQRLMTDERKAVDAYSIKKIDAEKNLALREHRTDLANLIGPEAGLKLDNWLDSDVRSRIQMIRMEPAAPNAR